jgi:hypothetical protein
MQRGNPFRPPPPTTFTAKNPSQLVHGVSPLHGLAFLESGRRPARAFLPEPPSSFRKSGSRLRVRRWWAQRFMRRLHPSSGFRPGTFRGSPREPCSSSRPRTMRSVAYGQPPSFVRCGSLPGPDAFARPGIRERWVLLFASPASVDFVPSAHPCPRFVGRRPVGLNLHVPQLSPRSADADPPRTTSPVDAGGACNRKEPTSDVPCRSSGTDHRLQPTHRCLRTPLAPCDARKRTTDSPEKPAPPSDLPVRDGHSNDARRLKRSRDALHAFTPARSSHAPHLGGLRA